MAHRAPSASKAKRREAPPHLKQSPTCNFQCGETVALHSSTLDEARRAAAQNASNLPRISTSDYIRLYQIISDHPRLYPIIPLHDPRIRLNSMKIELCQMGPDRRAEEGLHPVKLSSPETIESGVARLLICSDNARPTATSSLEAGFNWAL